MNLVLASCSKEGVISPLTVQEIAQAQTLMQAQKNLKTSIRHNWSRIQKPYVKMENWSFLQLFNRMQLVGTTTIFSTLDTKDLKKLFALRSTVKI